MSINLHENFNSSEGYERLRNDVADILLGPDSTVCETSEFELLSNEHDRLMQRQAELRSLDANLARVLPGLEHAESCLASTRKQLTTEKRDLTRYVTQLGKASFAALRSGELPDHAVFDARKEIQSRIKSLRTRKSKLLDSENARAENSAALQTQLTEVDRQLKAEALNTETIDRALGVSILTSREKLNVRCSLTEEVLKAIAEQRKQVATTKGEVTQAEALMADRMSSAAASLDRSAIRDAAFLRSERQIVNLQLQANKTALDEIRESAVNKALNCEALHCDADLRDRLGKLAFLRDGLPLKQSENRRGQRTEAGIAVSQSDSNPSVDVTQPKLWNPNAAGFWSLLFWPIFGAWIHALNWKALGKPEKARQSWFWAFGLGALLLGYIASLWLNVFDFAVYQLHYACAVLWWLLAGHSQHKYVMETTPGYQKKRWARPVLIATVVTVWLVGLSIALEFDQRAAIETKQFQAIENAAADVINHSIQEDGQNAYQCTRVTIENAGTTGTFDAIAYFDDGESIGVTLRVDGEQLEVTQRELPPHDL